GRLELAAQRRQRGPQTHAACLRRGVRPEQKDELLAGVVSLPIVGEIGEKNARLAPSKPRDAATALHSAQGAQHFDPPPLVQHRRNALAPCGDPRPSYLTKKCLQTQLSYALGPGTDSPLHTCHVLLTPARYNRACEERDAVEHSPRRVDRPGREARSDGKER